jgi:hypothetical protein
MRAARFLADEANHRLHHEAEDAVALGWTYQRIGNALGVRRQTAFKMFSGGHDGERRVAATDR